MTTAVSRKVLMNLAKARTLAALLLITHLLWPVNASASVRYVWAVNDGEKIERDDLDNPNKNSNSAWDGRRIRIFGARNEIIAFQLMVEAGSDGIKQLSVSLPELRQQGGKARITYAAQALDPTNYAGRPIQLFSLNYMQVETASHAEWVFQPGSPAAPKDPTRGKPVQLVPQTPRVGRGGVVLPRSPRQAQQRCVVIC